MTASLTIAERARHAVESFSLRNFVLALVAAALLAGVAAAWTLRGPAEYRSSAVLIIDSPLALATTGNDGVVNKLERLRGKYATLADTEVIAEPVADVTGVPTEEVIRDTHVRPSTLSLAIIVSAVGTEPDLVESLAVAMSEAVGEFVEEEHETNDVPPENRFVIEVVQPASSPEKTSPSNDRAMASAGVVFLAALAIAYVALQLLRPPVPAGQSLRRDEPAGAGPRG